MADAALLALLTKIADAAERNAKANEAMSKALWQMVAGSNQSASEGRIVTEIVKPIAIVSRQRSEQDLLREWLHADAWYSQLVTDHGSFAGNLLKVRGSLDVGGIQASLVTAKNHYKPGGKGAGKFTADYLPTRILDWVKQDGIGRTMPVKKTMAGVSEIERILGG